jgi:drug/metabolite transporter superfamily protein YnfA
MIEVEEGAGVELTAEMIRAQLDLMVRDEVFRSSKRSVAFLRYVVEQTLNGSADQIKERTIGVEVFSRKPSYDTNLDHIVRTAATELRKRLAIYYGAEKHRSELRMGLVPGSYIPRFTLPAQTQDAAVEPGMTAELAIAPQPAHIELSPEPLLENAVPANVTEPRIALRHWVYVLSAVVFLSGCFLGYRWLHRPTAQELFWKPVLETPGPVLLAVGDVPNGPPTLPAAEGEGDFSTPIPRPASSETVPFPDTVTIAWVVGELEAKGKKVLIRRETASSFSDLREGAVVLIGAFNNEWSLRLTHQLRYSLALDADRHLIYIRDAKNPSSRVWSWGTNQPRSRVGGPHSPALQDYALISRIRNSETGHVVVVIGGLYTYGTQAAGEFLTDPQLMQAISKVTQLDTAHQNLQIVLGTTVTDDTPGPPRVLAVATE